MPGYENKRNNPNIQAHRDEIYNNILKHNERGKDYLEAIGNTAAVASALLGNAGGVLTKGLGAIDTMIDFANFIDNPNMSTGTDVVLDTDIGKRLTKIIPGRLDDIIINPISRVNDAYSITGNSLIETINENTKKARK